jgi:hypothetical protein
VNRWVPPFFTCGQCGGEAGRWPVVNLLRQEILDWRHREIPPGAEPHRVILGTPANHVRLHRPPEEADAPVQEVAPPPDVPARPAVRDELPTAALRVDSLAAANGWEVEAWYMRGPLMSARWEFSRTVESVVLRMRRDGHGLVATWQADSKLAWQFDGAWSLGHFIEPLSSAARMICETCHEPPALHVSTNTGPVCHNEFYLPKEA